MIRLLALLAVCMSTALAQEYHVNATRTGVTSETITVQQLTVPTVRVRGKYMMIRCSVACTVLIRRASSPATGAVALTPEPGPDTANAAKFEAFRQSNAGAGTALNDTGDTVPAGGGFLWDMTAILLSQPSSGITVEISMGSSGDITFRSRWEQF